MVNDILFSSVLIADLVGLAVIVIGLLHERSHLFPSYHKVGLIVTAVGLLAQSAQCLQYLVAGITVSALSLPSWAFITYGIAAIGGGYGLKAYKEFHQVKREEKIEAAVVALHKEEVATTKKPATRKTPAKKAVAAKKPVMAKGSTKRA
jgi:hypothetical protein